jgi:hypothetical protein
MLDYRSLSTDELREVLASAAAKLNSRRKATVNGSSTQHPYRITMRRTANAEPRAFCFTLVEGTVVQLPLPLDQVIGKTGKVIGGEVLLNDGDVVQKIAASGLVSYLIAWQGSLDNREFDISQVFDGESEDERIGKVEAFVRGDRTFLIKELTDAIEFWTKSLAEYEEKGKTDEYWKRTAQYYRSRIPNLEAMLRWAQSTSCA